VGQLWKKGLAEVSPSATEEPRQGVQSQGNVTSGRFPSGRTVPAVLPATRSWNQQSVLHRHF